LLYNPKWKTKTTTPPSYNGFIAWLAAQPPGKKYNFYDVNNCVVARYLQEMGEKRYALDGAEIRTFLQGNLHVVTTTPWTYGAALRRARPVRGFFNLILGVCT
jgi:hypothetical protein